MAISKSSLLTRNVRPPCSNTSSSSFDSSRAIPKEGPAQPPSVIMSRIVRASSLSLRNSLIISTAFSVTSNICASLSCGFIFQSIPFNISFNLYINTILSILISLKFFISFLPIFRFLLLALTRESHSPINNTLR